MIALVLIVLRARKAWCSSANRRVKPDEEGAAKGDGSKSTAGGRVEDDMDPPTRPETPPDDQDNDNLCLRAALTAATRRMENPEVHEAILMEAARDRLNAVLQRQAALADHMEETGQSSRQSRAVTDATAGGARWWGKLKSPGPASNPWSRRVAPALLSAATVVRSDVESIAAQTHEGHDLRHFDYLFPQPPASPSANRVEGQAGGERSAVGRMRSFVQPAASPRWRREKDGPEGDPVLEAARLALLTPAERRRVNQSKQQQLLLLLQQQTANTSRHSNRLQHG